MCTSLWCKIFFNKSRDTKSCTDLQCAIPALIAFCATNSDLKSHLKASVTFSPIKNLLMSCKFGRPASKKSGLSTGQHASSRRWILRIPFWPVCPGPNACTCGSAKVLVDGSQFVIQLGLEVNNDLCVAFDCKSFGTELYIFMYRT